MQIKLSILVPTVHTRHATFLPKMEKQLYDQYNSLNESDRKQVEILILSDCKTIMLGEKRNVMIDIAQGEYVVFVDDDDRVSDTYIYDLLRAAESGADVITFLCQVSINGKKDKICDYSMHHRKDYNTRDQYRRIPNHICCTRKELASSVSFPNVIYGEDALYAKLLLPSLKTEHRINKVLYYYDYNKETSETQEFMPQQRTYKHTKDAVCDIVILSKSDTPELIAMTQKSIDTAIKGANGLAVNVFVVEQTPEVFYENAKTIYHEAPFNYNAFCNLGASQGSAKNIIFANNDLVFTDSYLHYLLSANYPLVSPHEPNDPRQRGLRDGEKGVTNGRHFSGWCFMMARDLWEKIGRLDEEPVFWMSDDYTIEQCLQVGIKPMIITKSIVKHLGSTTFKRLDQSTQEDYTWKLVARYNERFGRNKFADNKYYKDYLKRHGQG